MHYKAKKKKKKEKKKKTKKQVMFPVVHTTAMHNAFFIFHFIKICTNQGTQHSNVQSFYQ